MTSAIELESVTKRFTGTKVAAVDGVSISVAPGEFVALLGASGCGKSTTLRIMAGLEHPDSGRVKINGQDVTSRSASSRNIALMFQSYALYPHLTVNDNIATPLRQRRLSAAGRLPGARWVAPGVSRTLDGIDQDVRRVAEVLQLGKLLNRKPGQLSGGQQQRVALARSLVREPSAFLLDEPLSNLDTQLRADTREEIRGLHARTGHPFILVTHDQSDALAMADRVAVMIAGRIAQLDVPERIFNAPSHRDVAAFIGVHRMNLIEPGPAAAALHPAGATYVAGVRPEHLELQSDGGLEAVVRSSAFQGDEALLRLTVNDLVEIRVVLRGTEPPPVDATVRVGAPAKAVHLFDAETGQRYEVGQWRD